MVLICYEEGEGCEVRMGYVVELQKKKGFFEEYGEVQKVLMRGEKLGRVWRTMQSIQGVLWGTCLSIMRGQRTKMGTI